ncbi:MULTISPECIES: SusC/RagA family TonB-linked outer membrane protein [Olivibacter]|uniref:SusC/RagA family TonB-linked outer membrane protein n=2 Tax=Olivibacter TaxID=376469 RepID=A0ABV6HI94_9SPHI|nr:MULTISPECIES: TonB-dependent receptor [Olivibacter]MCL4639796.1 TonB-dependent receptor [Olivibacter sp. UJ_SKK_5.1]MDX3913551.1 TonB-dependent receptor [Pseudosphingobacterium sp.]QEL01487.1 TonB-dependent receptor [Olivibacter sp. LS-1]
MKKIKTRPLKKRSLIFADYRFRCLLAFLLYAATAYSQQTFTIQGTVKAIDTKESLPGVSIVANNKAIAISDANGNFAVKVNANTSIIFKYVGYRPYTLNVTSNLTKLSISLESANTLLEDVVVVGYGTQKKENVTGSVSTLDMKEKEGSPTTNISNALAGMPGMFVRLGQSQPGIDRSEIRIRGMGTLSNNNPLVLVNGIEYSMDELNPDDIQTVTVLKDASAAIYGSRAANGVILITTKKGTGVSQVNYNYYNGIQNPTRMPDVIWDPIQYMRLKNQALANQGQAPVYSDSQIEEYQAGMASDPHTYPANNWFDIALKDGNIQKHNLSFGGSSDTYQYRLSLGYLDRDGIIIGPSDNEKRYSLGFNASINISQRLKVGASIDGYYRNYEQPFYGNNFFQYLSRTLPILTDRLADGRYGNSWLSTPGRNNWENPRMIAETGYSKKIVQRFLASVFGEYKLPWNITYNIKFGADKYDGLLSQFTPQVQSFNPKTLKPTNWNSPATAPRSNKTDDNDLNLHFYNTLDWKQQFKQKHNVAIMVGSAYDYFSNGQFAAEMTGYLDETLTALSVGSIRNAISGKTTEDVLISYFGRANYDYKNKYLLEATFRYDGSSRFSKENRWGFFPSILAGWRIDQENFFNSNTINLLKLRASVGRLGNQAVELYSYENNIELKQDYSFGGPSGLLAPGAAALAYADPRTTWETTTTYNGGLDIELMQSKLNLTADVYKKHTTGILRTVNFPSQVGLTGPKRNVGTVDNTGYELTAQYRDQIGAVSYGIQGNVAYNKNKVIDLDGQILYDFDTNLSTITKEGLPISAHYLLQADGFFQNQEEIDNHAFQSNATRPGYIKYKDINGDNIINGEDRVALDESSAIPKYTYGFGFNIDYKGLSFRAFFQGIAGLRIYPMANLAYPFNNGAGATTEWLTDAWTPENTQARLPIVTESTGNKDNFLQSDFWLKSGSYLRLKNVQLAYLIPQKWTSKINIAKVSVFVNAENFLTFSKYKDFDPETIINYSSLYHYPMLKTFSGGINVTF